MQVYDVRHLNGLHLMLAVNPHKQWTKCLSAENLADFRASDSMDNALVCQSLMYR